MTAKEVAEWMVEELERDDFLSRDAVIYDIEERFGEAFVYMNDDGNHVIDHQVLSEFRKLTSKTVVWERKGRYWRFREEWDEPSRVA